jgi:rare lipoprotein A
MHQIIKMKINRLENKKMEHIKFYIFLIFNILLIIISLFFQSCTSITRFSNTKQEYIEIDKNLSKNTENLEIKPGQIIRGVASYYSDDFIGRKTANGEIYSKTKFTAAHRTLPFGTKLKVTNLKNSKFVFVVVNDRGPFISGRMLDLSYSAAAELDMIKDGVAEVYIEIVDN